MANFQSPHKVHHGFRKYSCRSLPVSRVLVKISIYLQDPSEEYLEYWNPCKDDEKFHEVLLRIIMGI